MNAFMNYQNGAQFGPPRFGQGNPFTLGVPGMGGYGGPMKPQLPMQLGLQQNKRRKMIPQMMPRNAFMGMARPY